MEKYDPEKIRFFSSEKGFNPGYVMQQFRDSFDQLDEMTDLLYNSNGVRMSKERYRASKGYLKAYQKTMMAFRDTEPIGRLTTDQQREILVLVNEVLEGKRECVQFQLGRGCEGITEMFSGKYFEFRDYKNNRTNEKSDQNDSPNGAER